MWSKFGKWCLAGSVVCEKTYFYLIFCKGDMRMVTSPPYTISHVSGLHYLFIISTSTRDRLLLELDDNEETRRAELLWAYKSHTQKLRVTSRWVSAVHLCVSLSQVHAQLHQGCKGHASHINKRRVNKCSTAPTPRLLSNDLQNLEHHGDGHTRKTGDQRRQCWR